MKIIYLIFTLQLNTGVAVEGPTRIAVFAGPDAMENCQTNKEVIGNAIRSELRTSKGYADLRDKVKIILKCEKK
jgi:hypothetical protein